MILGRRKTGFKLKPASLLSGFVSHQAGCGHPQDEEGDPVLFLAVTRVIKVGELGRAPGDRGCARGPGHIPAL